MRNTIWLHVQQYHRGPEAQPLTTVPSGGSGSKYQIWVVFLAPTKRRALYTLDCVGRTAPASCPATSRYGEGEGEHCGTDEMRRRIIKVEESAYKQYLKSLPKEEKRKMPAFDLSGDDLPRKTQHKPTSRVSRRSTGDSHDRLNQTCWIQLVSHHV
eukprot:gb/GECG01011062.1/.p1 GENE.gb/GECG01011062.1/~~gb/GECG01011062.1/.p1  ORF type:complete len:156 (+),score=9.62 gb/GECG01011062.1/:1-468(+)